MSREERALDQTGIRTLRRQTGLSPRPTCFRPPDFSHATVDRRPGLPGGGRAAELLHLQAGLRGDPSFLRPALSRLRRAEISRKRTELADLRGRVALLTGGRVKIGYQAGIKLLRAGAQLIVTTRFPARLRRALRRRAGFCANGATGSRSSGSTCGTRRAWRRSASELIETRDRARFHHQQRLPDRAAPAGVLRAHDGAGNGVAA